MKLLTIRINGRTDHVVNFDSQKPDSQKPNLNSYIIENNGDLTDLLSFFHNTNEEKFILQTDNGEETATLKGLEINLNEAETDETLKIRKVEARLYIESEGLQQSKNGRTGSTKNGSTKAEPANPTTQNFHEQYWDWDSKNLRVQFKAESGWSYIINVTLTLACNNELKNKTLIINFAPRANIYDVVLDYGSEASQMLIYNRNVDHINDNNRVPLFDLFRRSLNNEQIKQYNNNDFVQYDSDGEYFFKSSIFANKHDQKTEATAPIANNNNIKFLTPLEKLEEIKKDYFIIPNIKIARHGVVLPRIDGIQINDNYYSSIINAFLQQALNYVISQNNESAKFLNLYLLVPNVYTQINITNYLKNASSDVMSMAGDITDFNSIKGVEVAAVSESDASFLGYISSLMANSQVHIPGGQYLIMDAGKGTLDFSVLKYNPEEENDMSRVFRSEFRSGIIGAGNAITYSIFLAILKDIYRICGATDDRNFEQEISNFVAKEITNPNADEAELNKLVSYLEEYKKLYNSGDLRQNNTNTLNNLLGQQQFEDLELKAVLNCLTYINKNKYLIRDESYIDNMIDTLCYDAVNKLRQSYQPEKDSKINYVVFAGRGFQMTKLRERMVQYLRSNPEICSENLEPITISDSEGNLKKICLFILSQLSSGCYNGRLVGTPQVLHHTDTNAAPAEEQPKTNPKTNRLLKSNLVSKLKERISLEALTIWFIKKLNGGNVGPMNDDDKNYSNRLDNRNIDRISSELVYGFPADFITATDLVVFSGVAYRTPVIGSAQIFFDGNKFVVRKDGMIYNFGPATNISAEHVYESTFPYGQLANRQNIPFPARPVDPQTDAQTQTQTQPNNSSDRGEAEDESLLTKYNK